MTGASIGLATAIVFYAAPGVVRTLYVGKDDAWPEGPLRASSESGVREGGILELDAGIAARSR